MLLGRVLQAAGRLSLDVRCVRLVSSSCSCLDQHLVFVAALGGDETFSTRGNIRSLRSGACSLLLGGLARGFEVRVDLKLDRVARGVRPNPSAGAPKPARVDAPKPVGARVDYNLPGATCRLQGGSVTPSCRAKTHAANQRRPSSKRYVSRAD